MKPACWIEQSKECFCSFSWICAVCTEVSTSGFQGINWKFIFGELIWIWFEPCSSLLSHCWPQKLGAERCRRLGNKSLGSVSQIPEHPDILGLWLRAHLHFGSLLMGFSLFLWQLGSWACSGSKKTKKAILFFFDVWSIPSERSGVDLKSNKGKKYLYKGKIPACPRQKYRNSRGGGKGLEPWNSEAVLSEKYSEGTTLWASLCCQEQNIWCICSPQPRNSVILSGTHPVMVWDHSHLCICPSSVTPDFCFFGNISVLSHFCQFFMQKGWAWCWGSCL